MLTDLLEIMVYDQQATCYLNGVQNPLSTTPVFGSYLHITPAEARSRP